VVNSSLEVQKWGGPRVDASAGFNSDICVWSYNHCRTLLSTGYHAV
jgi:hypothetical protein